MTTRATIIKAAIDPDFPLETLLGHCRLFASQLPDTAFAGWIDLELSGYPPGSELPEYRTVATDSIGTFASRNTGEVALRAIPLAGLSLADQETLQCFELCEPVGSYIDLLAADSTLMFESPWPHRVVQRFADTFYEGWNCTQAVRQIPRTAMSRVLRAVRGRALNTVMAANEPESRPGLPPGAASQQFQPVLTVSGQGANVNVVLAGHDATLTATTQGSGADAELEQLKKYLQASLGLNTHTLAELGEALAADKRTPQQGMGPRVASWLGQVVAQASKGVLKLGAAEASSLVASALEAYLKLPGQGTPPAA